MENTKRFSIRRKLTVTVLLLLLICLVYHGVTTSMAYTAKNATINANGVRIRKSPVNGGVIASLNKNHAVKIVNEKKGSDKKVWYNVTFTYSKASKKGWVRSDLVKVKSSASKPSTSKTSTTTMNKSGKVKGSSVNVRKSAVNGAVVCTVKKNLAVKITKQTKGSDKKTWYYITFKQGSANKAGWIRSDYITITSTSSKPAVTTINKTGKIKGNGRIIRKSAVNGATVCKVNNGVAAKLTKQTTGSDKKTWYYVTVKVGSANKSGWIRSDYITITTTPAATSSTTTINKNGKVKGIGVNVRKSPVSGASIAKVNTGLAVKLTKQTKGSDKKTWYYITFKAGSANKAGWIRSDFVTITTTTTTTPKPTQPQTPSASDNDFESSLTKQGFPESYKTKLRELHKKYPKWKFEAQKTGLNWNTVIENESKLGVNLVSSSSIASWKSTQNGAFNWSNNTWPGFDGPSWVAASEGIIKHYMDPRNFLDENYIFQFMKQKYDAADQNLTGLKAATKGSFLEKTYTESNKKVNYTDTLMTAGKQSGVSPYALSAMIIIEQGINGTGNSISGNVSGYKGYYNFFNIGAYATSSMTAVQRGLWFAKGEGKNNTSYNRPWNTRTKSIIGGATHYGSNYVKVGQDTLYLKKFNVQGSNIYKHQYMTNIVAAASEGSRMAKAYTGSAKSAALSFKIPIYNSMPASACAKPTGTGNPNYKLKSLSVDGQKLTPTFKMDTYEYSIIVENSVASVNIKATPAYSGAVVSGTGKLSLKVGKNTRKITVKAQNGTSKTYTLTIERKQK